MQVREVMSARPEYLDHDATIQDAARRMKETNRGSIPIGKDNKLVGMLTDRDICVHSIAEGRDSNEKVGNLVNGKVLYCYENDDVRDVLHNMKEQHVQRLAVVKNEDDKDFVGVVTVGDIADKCSDNELARDIVECCKHYH